MSKFSIEDKVKVKDFYDIAVTLDKQHKTHNVLFNKEMVDLCGKTFMVSRIRTGYMTSNSEDVIELVGTGFVFVDEWLELVALKCTLADVFEYDSDLAYCFADQIRDKWNILALDLDYVLDDDDFEENATYRTRHAKDIILRFDRDNPNVDKWHTHAVIFEGYGYLDCVCSSCVDELLCKKTA